MGLVTTWLRNPWVKETHPGEEHGPPRTREHGRVPGTGLSVSALHWILAASQAGSVPPNSRRLVAAGAPSAPAPPPGQHSSIGTAYPAETIFLPTRNALKYRITRKRKRTVVGRDRAVLDLEPHPPLQRGTVLDPSNSAALTSGIASLAPLTLNHFLQPPLLPAAWPPRRGQMLVTLPPSPERGGQWDPRARHHTCRRVPLRQSALLSSSVRREVRGPCN